MISVVIPVKDGGSDLVRCLGAIASQRVSDDVELIVVDSGSTDGSLETAKRLGARVSSIAPTEFHHGRTRNLGAELARGDVLVFTSQDAYAADERWLANLTAPLAEASIAGAYGRQLPHRDARPPERYFLEFLYGPEGRTQRLESGNELSFELTLFSNVNSAIPRQVWERYRFAEDIIMSEDQEWSRRVLRAGMAIRYTPTAAVHHSHSYTVADAFRRFFDSGVSAERSYVDDGRESRAALWKAGLRYAQGEVVWLWRNGERRWIPYATLYELAKFAGLQLGRRHGHLPRRLSRRLSDYPQYWST